MLTICCMCLIPMNSNLNQIFACVIAIFEFAFLRRKLAVDENVSHTIIHQFLKRWVGWAPPTLKKAGEICRKEKEKKMLLPKIPWHNIFELVKKWKAWWFFLSQASLLHEMWEDLRFAVDWRLEQLFFFSRSKVIWLVSSLHWDAPHQIGTSTTCFH